MAKEIIMPKFGFTQEESEILEWLHDEGDQVEKGDPIAVVSTDKISMEVEAPEDGILAGVRYQVGDVVPVTKVIAFILQPGEDLPETDQEEPAAIKGKSQPEAKKQKVRITPVAKKLLEENGLQREQVVDATGKENITREDVENYLQSLTMRDSGKVRATPAARRLSRELNTNLQAISGSGPHGRVQEEDVEKANRSGVGKMDAGDQPQSSIPMNNIRKLIARNMVQSWQEIPQMTLQADINVEVLEEYRAALNAAITKKEKRITVTALIAKATAIALKKHPILNSQFSGEEILLNHAINIGIATALDDGLIVPVVHNADRKAVATISDEIRDLSRRAREGGLAPDELSGGTFTISNLGMFEIDRFTAIINPPQAAILAVGKKNKVFRPAEGYAFRVEEIITVTLSADHRVMDGVQAARFLAELKTIIENLKGFIA